MTTKSPPEGEHASVSADMFPILTETLREWKPPATQTESVPAAAPEWAGDSDTSDEEEELRKRLVIPKLNGQPRAPNVGPLAKEKTVSSMLEGALEISDPDDARVRILGIGIGADRIREAYRTWSAWAQNKITPLYNVALNMQRLIHVLDVKVKIKDAEIKSKDVEIATLRAENAGLHRVVNELQQHAPREKLQERLKQLREAAEAVEISLIDR